MRTKLIYGLVDPRTDEVRYVGRSSSGLARPRAHFAACNLKESTHKANWIKGLLAKGFTPTIKVLSVFDDSVSNEQINAGEVWWIDFFRACNVNLTNGTDGGDGVTGWIPSEETRWKISKANTGRKLGAPSEEHRKKISDAKKGHSVSGATRVKIAAALTGRYSGCNNPMYGKRHSEKTKQQLRGLNVGRTFTEETKKKISALSKGHWEGARNPVYKKGKTDRRYCTRNSGPSGAK